MSEKAAGTISIDLCRHHESLRQEHRVRFAANVVVLRTDETQQVLRPVAARMRSYQVVSTWANKELILSHSAVSSGCVVAADAQKRGIRRRDRQRSA